MEWTNEIPTETGFYWKRSHEGTLIVPIRIRHGELVSEEIFKDEDHYGSLIQSVSYENLQYSKYTFWCGPLLPPLPMPSIDRE